MINFPLNISSNWHSDFSSLTSEQSAWLLECGSLTAKLKETYLHFEVKVLSEKQFILNSEQAQVLGIAPQPVLCREVLLYGDDVARVYAQSWIPTAQLNHSNALLNLGNKPLGEYIFQHPELKRHAIEVTCFDRPQELAPLFTLTDLPQERLWSRRSVFSLQDLRLMVCETFLPGVF